MPLVVARGDDGAVRVFHNVCSHRGSMLVEQPQRGAKSITCPYHQWRYGTDGRLEHTPHAGGFRVHHAPEVPHDRLGLTPVRSRCWNGFVFADISGTALDFDERSRT